MTTVYFVRHAQKENPDNVLELRLPGFSLTARGRVQAKDLATIFEIKNPQAIFSSPLERCWETAEIISKVVSLPITSDDRLLEIRSPFQGMPKDKFEARFFGKHFYSDPEHLAGGGETSQDIVSRMKSFLDMILTEHKDQVVVVVSHADPIMFLELSLTGRDYHLVIEGKTPNYIPQAGFFEFRFEGKKFLGESWSWQG